MKFDEYRVLPEDWLMIGNEEKECVMCGAMTRYIDIASEGRFCSDECMEKFYEELSKKGEATEWTTKRNIRAGLR